MIDQVRSPVHPLRLPPGARVRHRIPTIDSKPIAGVRADGAVDGPPSPLTPEHRIGGCAADVLRIKRMWIKQMQIDSARGRRPDAEFAHALLSLVKSATG